MSNTEPDDAMSVHGMIIAKAWSDPAFKAKLLAVRMPPKRLGLGMRPGTTLKMVEDTDNHVHLVLPSKPAGDPPSRRSTGWRPMPAPRGLRGCWWSVLPLLSLQGHTSRYPATFTSARDAGS